MNSFHHLPRPMPDDFSVPLILDGGRFVARVMDNGAEIEFSFVVKAKPIDALHLVRYVNELRYAMWNTLEIHRLKRLGLWKSEAA